MEVIILSTLALLFAVVGAQFENSGCIPGDYPYPPSDTCSSFFRCYASQIFVLRCPENQSFHYARRQCRPRSEVDCTLQLRMFLAPPSVDGNPGPALNIFSGLNQRGRTTGFGAGIPQNTLVNQFGQGGFNSRFGLGQGGIFRQQSGIPQFQVPQQFNGNRQPLGAQPLPGIEPFPRNPQFPEPRPLPGSQQFPGQGFGVVPGQNGLPGSQPSVIPGQLYGNNNRLKPI